MKLLQSRIASCLDNCVVTIKLIYGYCGVSIVIWVGMIY